ncbi:selenocysteine-specific translation elongation factor [Novosphingobium sp.]|uniref:selenocysteine-specific translation elongation factor n=1 Tax=Novosphingobium sp. TaxID=1874826 RepID=UPI00286E88B6|nr:selenocysteine-specific translation elongation factor [Novosphingobium sp.]
MLVATAGHVDHGKTSLVRALTGVETDRLPEEKARGISIDLGFAYWRPDDGATIGFIDVPGHERFVRNMIAGLSGVGFAMVVVAADDGVMPQTREHVWILDLLGVVRGLVVLTKMDAVDAVRVAEVAQDMAELLAGTSLAGSQVFAVSSVTGSGLAGLGAALRDAYAASPADTGHNFRLSIDRAFSVTGTGTVVTGTVLAGQAAIGEALVLSSTGREVRLRGMQSGGREVERIGAGARCAINLAGLETSEIHRGDWLVAPTAHAPTSRIEARVTILAERVAPLRHDSHVHLHIGTADLGARVQMPRQKGLAPGVPGSAVLVLDAPTQAVSGDRFVLRDSSGRELLGGGVVLDPLASVRRRSVGEREARAAALAHANPADKLAALASAPGIEPDARWFAQACNLTPEAMAVLLEGYELAGKSRAIIVSSARYVALGDRLIAALADHHARHPDESGLLLRAARTVLEEPVSSDLFTGLVGDLSAHGRIQAEGALLRLPSHSARFSEAENSFWRRAIELVDDRALVAITAAELARDQRLGEPAVQAMLQRRRTSGDLWQVTGGKFMLRDHVAALVALAAELDEATGTGFTAAQLRDASGIGRNFIIQLLEFCDRIGVTRRSGEMRRMRGDWQAVVGAAPPWRKPAR